MAPGAKLSRAISKTVSAASPLISVLPLACKPDADARLGGPKFAAWRHAHTCFSYSRSKELLPPNDGAATADKIPRKRYEEAGPKTHRLSRPLCISQNFVDLNQRPVRSCRNSFRLFPRLREGQKFPRGRVNRETSWIKRSLSIRIKRGWGRRKHATTKGSASACDGSFTGIHSRKTHLTKNLLAPLLEIFLAALAFFFLH